MGRKPLFGRRMTPAEKQKRYRERKKQREREMMREQLELKVREMGYPSLKAFFEAQEQDTQQFYDSSIASPYQQYVGGRAPERSYSERIFRRVSGLEEAYRLKRVIDREAREKRKMTVTYIEIQNELYEYTAIPVGAEIKGKWRKVMDTNREKVKGEPNYIGAKGDEWDYERFWEYISKMRRKDRD